MASNNKIKYVLLIMFSVLVLVWVFSSAFSRALGVSVDKDSTGPALMANVSADDYVGSESCKECHEDQFKKFNRTKHAKLKEVASWKDKVQGCESCHGPGKAASRRRYRSDKDNFV